LLVCLVVLKRFAAMGVASNLGLLVVAGAFTVTPLAERHFDGASVAWFCIIPFIAVLLRGARAALVWVPVVLGLLVWLYLQPERPDAWSDAARFVTLARTGGLIVTVLAFALSFEEAQREAREQLLAANQAKSRFLANMSHEIRTPMNGVLGMTEVLLGRSTDDQTRAQLRVVRQSGQALVALINSILDLSKIEAGKLVVDAQPFSLAAVLDEVYGLYLPVAAQRSLRFSLERADDVSAWVTGDALRLRQVLSNLVDNALKFTARGHITLAVTRVGAGTRFEVTDTGPGIPPAVAARLFTPFEQADSSTTRRYGGSGLGLALARQLVELMGGALQLDTEVGHGSRFSFTLPLPAAPPVQARPPEGTQPASASRSRVLVVDDNPINLKVATALVRAAGYEVGEATDGRLALKAVTDGRWDLVLMDCHMPEMDGYEATRAIRRLDGTRGRVPIIALTAAAMADELALCREAGMNDCLTKPVNAEALRAALAQALAVVR
jgi:signal transduction histidine kinase/ActR/RegA family two-component response regulator